MAGFRIKYAKEGGSATMIVVGTMTTYTLTSLEKNTIYKVTVSVMNSMYTGKSSAEFKTRTLEDGKNLYKDHLLFMQGGKGVMRDA